MNRDLFNAGSRVESAADAATRTAIFNIDPGETVRCTFLHEVQDTPGEDDSSSGNTGSEEASDGDQGPSGDGVNPFDDPDTYLTDFPVPNELPPDAGSDTVPRAGPWDAFNLADQMNCSGSSPAIPAAAPETGVIEVLEAGQTLVGTSLQEDQTVPLEMRADPTIAGRYTSAIEGMEQGVPIIRLLLAGRHRVVRRGISHLHVHVRGCELHDLRAVRADVQGAIAYGRLSSRR